MNTPVLDATAQPGISRTRPSHNVPTQTLPWGSAATALVYQSFASIAGPPSPELPFCPIPAMVVTASVESTPCTM